MKLGRTRKSVTEEQQKFTRSVVDCKTHLDKHIEEVQSLLRGLGQIIIEGNPLSTARQTLHALGDCIFTGIYRPIIIILLLELTKYK